LLTGLNGPGKRGHKRDAENAVAEHFSEQVKGPESDKKSVTCGRGSDHHGDERIPDYPEYPA
jgi:hypothetical protein